jgi:hypothetical protein
MLNSLLKYTQYVVNGRKDDDVMIAGLLALRKRKLDKLTRILAKSDNEDENDKENGTYNY